LRRFAALFSSLPSASLQEQGNINTYAGGGGRFTGDGKPAASAQIALPSDVTVEPRSVGRGELQPGPGRWRRKAWCPSSASIRRNRRPTRASCRCRVLPQPNTLGATQATIAGRAMPLLTTDWSTPPNPAQ